MDDARLGRYQGYIKRYDLTERQVLDEIDRSFGEPLLVVAAGSVIAGFGNNTSDLDLYTVVEDDVASTLPLMSYPNGARIDAITCGSQQLLDRRSELSSVKWPPEDMKPGDIGARRKAIDVITRYGLGVPLSGTDQWIAWQQRLEAEVGEWMSDWHAVEAYRMQAAARALLAHKPLVAGIRAGDALMAALERHAAAHGESYFKWKWLGEKLERLGDSKALSAYEQAVSPPLSALDVPHYLEQAESLLHTYLGDVDTSSWRLSLQPAVGTSWESFGKEHIVSRWGLRAAVVSAKSNVGKPSTWTYSLSEKWDADVEALFGEDMLWLGVQRTER
ncbi:hypothetical protein [Streptomyces johnsoniae]|uniref:Polymerase nucleotidyl transferase domain-containing protein n=1 Tax=Streptomyces johnsoniae TaxID=3075532 RepID=A0ABU2S5R7_9ACTN|nr:hypothetical protein [Streptomyces sp. DSM 41886]MDT0443779.1 hypothetical protein [Streptomyces sp. DSM 41886]